MRIGVGGIHTECSTYNPIRSRIGDFRVLRADALVADPAFAVLKAWPQHRFVGLLHARALPGGPVERATYEALRAEFLDRLAQALPLDGLYLAMHGAMAVEGLDDAEGDWIAAARAAVGPDCPVAASYDLHGNISQRVIDAVDMVSAYRTAPHIDVDETQARALAMLDAVLAGGPRPVVVWAKVPVLLPGERTSTVDEPARSLYARLPAVDGVPGVLDASILVGYVWADEPRATAAVVMTGTDEAVLSREAATLAQAYFDAREHFAFGPRVGSIAQCLDWADAATTRPVILAESGDNPTGGGVGDRTEVLHALLARGAEDTLVAGIADRPATEAAFAAGEGARVPLSIGATLDPAGSTPWTGEAQVVRLSPGVDAADRQAAVRIGGVTVVLTARRRPFHTLADFAALGLDPATVRLLVVKSGYLSPDLAPLAAPNLMALSEGVVDQDIPRLPARRIHRPTYPFDEDFAYVPQPTASARARLAAEAGPG